MLAKLSYWLAYKLAQKVERDDIDYIRYGIEVTLSLFSKFIVFFMIGIFLDILIELFAIIVSFAIFRSISGGVHMSTYLRCLTTSIIMFVFPAYFLKNFPVNNNSTLVILLITLLISIIVVIYYVPVEAANRPIPKEKHKVFKIIFLLFLVLWFSINILIQYRLPSLQYVSVFSSLGILLQNFTLIPLGYNALSIIDQYLDRRKKRLEVNAKWRKY